MAVHAGLAVAIARGNVPRRAASSSVELEFPREAPPPAEKPAAAPARSAAPSGSPVHRRLALRARPPAPVARPVEAPAPATPIAAAPPRARPVFAVAMASTSEIAVPAGGPSGPAAGSGPPGPGAAGGHGAPGASGGGRGPASESDIAKMPEIDTGACGRTIVYPREAEDAAIEGDVRLRVSLTPQGHVDDVRVLSGLGHGLDREAVEALRHRCRFSPAIDRGGKPVAFVIQSYVFHFELPR